MTRRWYRERELDRRSGAASRSDGTAYVTTSYEDDGRRHHLAAAFVDTQDLDDVAGAISAPRRAATRRASPSTSTSTPPRPPARSSRTRSSEALERGGHPAARRSASCSTCPRRTRGVSAADAITLRRSLDGGWALDRDLQFVHPEMAERLNLWRMSEFALERIPSPADVYLFRGVGRSNPKDERLFALAEVRELSVVRDDERAASSRCPSSSTCWPRRSSALRRFQARRSPRERLLWNRVRLNVWPDVDLAPDEAGALIDRYARETEGLGIETVIIRGPHARPARRRAARPRAAAVRARRAAA